MKIVKFKNGKFAIEKGWTKKRYKDLRTEGCWWAIGDKFFTDCLSDSLCDVLERQYDFKVVERWSI